MVHALEGIKTMCARVHTGQSELVDEGGSGPSGPIATRVASHAGASDVFVSQRSRTSSPVPGSRSRKQINTSSRASPTAGVSSRVVDE